MADYDVVWDGSRARGAYLFAEEERQYTARQRPFRSTKELTVGEVMEIRRAVRAGGSRDAVAARHHVSGATVDHLVRTAPR